MEDKPRNNNKSRILFAVLAAAILISAVISAELRKSDSKKIVIYEAASSAETESTTQNSSKADKSRSEGKKTTKVTTEKKPKETKSTTAKTSKTATVKTTKEKTAATSKETSEKTAPAETVYVFPIDINLVTFDELMAIDGVGESTAYAILDFRESVGVITYMEQLLEVSGIGEGKLEMLSQYLYVDDADYFKPDTETVTQAPESHTEVITTVPAESEPETTTTTTTTTAAAEEPQRQPVNINEADKQELMDCLLIGDELAEEILSVREQLGGKYENYLQLLYVKGISKEFLSEIKEYIEI